MFTRFYKMCGKKRRHTEESAARAMALTVALHPELAPRLQVYRCKRCRQWHFGKIPLHQLARRKFLAGTG